MTALLLINPRSGSGGPTADELAEAARRLGVDVRVLQEGDDAREIARSSGAEVLGMAGDPLAALAAFDGGRERRVDVGRVGDRLFLNNVSLGLYAQLVHRREGHRRRRNAFARVRALALTLRDRGRTQRFTIDGQAVKARVVLVANNAYAFDVLSIGERERLDEGRLHLYVPHGIRRVTWDERSSTELTIDADGHRVRAAIDGEPVELDTPLEFRIEPAELRLLVPRR